VPELEAEWPQVPTGTVEAIGLQKPLMINGFQPPVRGWICLAVVLGAKARGIFSHAFGIGGELH
jgi:hypothetical protein